MPKTVVLSNLVGYNNINYMNWTSLIKGKVFCEIKRGEVAFAHHYLRY